MAGRPVETNSNAFVDEVDAAVSANNSDTEFMEGIVDINERLWLSKQEGRAEGAADSQRKISELARRMAADGRQDDLVATLTDDDRLEEELHRYGIG